jgi:hypothetical protein
LAAGAVNGRVIAPCTSVPPNGCSSWNSPGLADTDPEPHATSSSNTPTNSQEHGHCFEMGAAYSSTRSMRSSAPKDSRSLRPRFVPQCQTRSLNAGSGQSAARSSTAPSSGTDTNSKDSWPTTSITPTSTDPTGHWINGPHERDHPMRPDPTYKRSNRPDATGSSTNTETQPDQPRHNFRPHRPLARSRDFRPWAPAGDSESMLNQEPLVTRPVRCTFRRARGVRSYTARHLEVRSFDGQPQ